MALSDKTSMIRASVMGHLERHKDANYDELLKSVKGPAGRLDRAEVTSVVIPMIASGTLKYGTNLRIQLAKKKSKPSG